MLTTEDIRTLKPLTTPETFREILQRHHTPRLKVLWALHRNRILLAGAALALSLILALRGH